MVVDFAYKQRARGNRGYALRSIKLGLSRKLIFVSGLLACFSCSLDFSDEQWIEFSKSRNPQPLIGHLRTVLNMIPLEILANRLASFESALPASKQLFDAYDKFVGLLADNKPTASGEPPRSHLGNLSVDDLESDTAFQEARQIRKEFGTALSDLFLKPGTELYNLVIEYGVF
jgi:hypothetical protein